MLGKQYFYNDMLKTRETKPNIYWLWLQYPPELGYNGTCTSRSQCLDSQLLECHNDTQLCQCNSTMFYNSTLNSCAHSKWKSFVWPIYLFTMQFVLFLIPHGEHYEECSYFVAISSIFSVCSYKLHFVSHAILIKCFVQIYSS